MATTERRQDWVIELMPDGTCDVTLNGRSEAYDLDDLEEALDRIKRRGGTQAVVIEPDGYRKKVKLS